MGKLNRNNDRLMGKKIGRNDSCPCGSGKKYKKCCFGRTDSPLVMKELYRKLISGELPFRAEIVSSSGEKSSMKIFNAGFVKDGIEQVLFDDEITLETNTINGDNVGESSAMITIPFKNNNPSEIITKGNAVVSNFIKDDSANFYYLIDIKDQAKKGLKIEDRNGLFAKIKINKQRDKGFFYFDLFFGMKYRPENIGPDGQKDRPHLAFYPDGNGKFIRLSGYDCEMISNLNYNPNDKKIYPSQIQIIVNPYSKKIVMDFEFNLESNLVTLMGGKFMDLV